MAIDITLKINNQLYQYSGIRVTEDKFVLTWDFDIETQEVEVDEDDGTFDVVSEVEQIAYEIIISDDNTNWGTSLFSGNIVDTGVIYNNNKSWEFKGKPIDRGSVCYGQIQVQDSLERTTEWKTFYIRYNNLPVVSDVLISPSIPTTGDSLSLTYDFSDNDSDTEQSSVIRWFKNGVRQRHLDGILTVGTNYLQIGDVWVVSVTPYDGYEYGEKVSSASIKITKSTVTVSSYRILPEFPNENDILKADFSTSDPIEANNVLIRWFINDLLISSFNDYRYLRYDFTPGDTVRYEVRSPYGTTFVSSDDVTISSSDFSVYDIKVDGMDESLEVSTTRPVISWKVHESYQSEVNYTSIKIGTFYESNNVYEGTIQGDGNIITVPENLLNRGQDYYVSIAASNTTTFSNYSTSHFRIKGSRWSDGADNSTGWTIETIFLIQDPGVYNVYENHTIRIQDGTKYCEVKIYNKKIGFISEDFLYSDEIDTSGSKILTIVGKESDVKIYLDRILILDATGYFTQTTSRKQLDLGNMNNNDFTVRYKYFYYTVGGSYYPGVNAEYSNMKFSTFLNFPNNEIVSLKGYVEKYENNSSSIDTKIFAINPHDEAESGSIYSILPADKIKTVTVNSTYSPINKIRLSPDGKRVVFGHAKGASVITGYYINPFSYEINFEEENSDGEKYNFPEQNGWELKQTKSFSAGYFDDDGFNINTIGI